MKSYLFIILIFCSTSHLLAQEVWGYLEFEIPNYNHHGAIEIINENQLHIVADNGYLYKTLNAGLDWTEFNSNVSEIFFDIKFFNTELGFAVGANGTLLKTQNGGDTWELINTGTSKDLLSIAFNSESSIWIVGANGVVLHSDDFGENWTLDSSLTNENLNSIKFKNINQGYIAGNNGVLLYTENGGQNWGVIAVDTTEDLFSISITDNYMYVLEGYTTNFDDYYYQSYRGLKTNDNENWSDFYFFNPQVGEYINNVFFLEDDIGFTIFSAALLCDCCFVSIEKTVDSGNFWTESFFEETTASNCNSNDGYADLTFLNPTFGYALLGNKILSTNEDVTIVVGTEDFTKDSSIEIFPNPSTENFFNIKFSNEVTDQLSLNILDVNGRLVQTETNLTELTRIIITGLETGIYFVTINEKGRIITSKKIIIQ